MKRNISFYLLLLITTISFAQQRIISGIIKDANTKAPILGVSISIKGTNMGTISNEEGKFRITVPEQYSALSLYHLNYTTLEYKINENSSVEMLLSPKVHLLEEVIVNKKGADKHKAENLLREAIIATKKKTNKNVLLHTYYRELNYVDEQITSFSEGILDYYLNDEGKRETDVRTYSDLYVKQSRVFDLRKSTQENTNPVFFDVKNAVKNGYNLDWLEFNILKHRKKYEFQVETKMEANGNSIDVIHIKPKVGKKVIKFPYVLAGSITCDSKTKLVLDIDLNYDPELKKYSETINLRGHIVKVNDAVMKSHFKIEGDKYVLTCTQLKFNFYFKVGESLNNKFEIAYDLTVLDYEEGEFEFDKTQKYQKKSLFENGNSYTEEFWKTQNIRLLSEAEENIIKTLNSNRVEMLP